MGEVIELAVKAFGLEEEARRIKASLPKGDALLDILAQECQRRYGDFDLDRFSDGTWRVWLKGWHQHEGACSGDLTGRGSTASEAFLRLFLSAKRNPPTPKSQTCKECLESVDF